VPSSVADKCAYCSHTRGAHKEMIGCDYCPCVVFTEKLQQVNPEPGQNTRLQRWADPAMFVSEPLSQQDYPQVKLLSAPADPLGSIAAMCKMYKGEVVRTLSEVTDDQRRHYLSEMQKTRLTTPLESVQLHFLLEGVTRSFTHQLVRQRTAAYAQESLRFAVVEEEDMDRRVALPPSLAGTKAVWRDLWHDISCVRHADWSESSQRAEMRDRMDRESLAEQQRWAWDSALDAVGTSYTDLINTGMPAEDARGLLPHNIRTRVHYITDLRGLLEHAGNRLCTQAQFEWRIVLSKIAQAIRTYSPLQGRAAGRSWPDGHWQFEAIADLLKPVCYATGKCEFTAEFDRACSIRDRVQANARHGIPSSQWPHGVDDPKVPETIPPIKPEEWLADPGAAR
jgi:flavin-dependent thymidylate synthase